MCLIAAHREAALPGVGGNVFLADGGDLDIIAALDEGKQFPKFGGVALDFQRDGAVVLVFHPAGQLQALGRIPGRGLCSGPGVT